MEANQIVSILRAQCAHLTTARIITGELGLICQSRFSTLSAESVLLELLDPPDTAYFRPLSLFVCQGRRKTRPEGRRKNRPLPVREGVDLLDRAGVAGAEACASVQAARLGRSGRHPSPIVATCGEG